MPATGVTEYIKMIQLEEAEEDHFSIYYSQWEHSEICTSIHFQVQCNLLQVF